MERYSDVQSNIQLSVLKYRRLMEMSHYYILVYTYTMSWKEGNPKRT